MILMNENSEINIINTKTSRYIPNSKDEKQQKIILKLKFSLLLE